MAAMALSRTAPPRAVVPLVAAVACGAALTFASQAACAAAFARTAPPLASAPAPASALGGGTAHAAASTLVTMTVDSVPALSLSAFQGSYAASTVAQNGGDASADGTQDPTGVLDRITVDQPAQSKTHSDPAKNWADAQPSVEYTLHGKKLYSISSVDAHAECTPSSPGATTYVHTSPTSVTVLGTTVAPGKTKLPITGAQLGITGVDHGNLDVSYGTTATEAQQTALMSGHAHLDLSISGVFYDRAGKQLYSGPLQKLRLGDVQVACQSSGTSTPTPAPTPTTAASVPGSPVGSTGTDSSQSVGPAVPSTLKGAPSPAAYVASPHHARHSGHSRGGTQDEAGPAVPENGTMLPAAKTDSTSVSGDGDASLWWALLSVLALGCGTGLYFATRRRGRHQ